MSDGKEALLLLGADLGAPPMALSAAAEALKEAGQVLAISRDHWTEPWGFNGGHLFLNRALLVRTALSPLALMGTCLEIERRLGRVRSVSGGVSSRIIDIDILLMGGLVMGGAELVLPHPRMHERAFALAPAADVAPGWLHPVLGRTVLQMLDDLRSKA